MKKYVIKNGNNMHDLTNIGRIGIIKRCGNEWMTFVKKINVDAEIEKAVIKLDSRGVCGAYVNGEYVEGNTGRYPNRITSAECTSKLKKGENEIRLVLGGHYYQPINNMIRGRAGAQFSFIAAELTIVAGGTTQTLVTDEGWECISDDGQTKPICFSEVTVAEYNRFWLSAALIPEYKAIQCPGAVAEVAGEGYTKYISQPWMEYKTPEKILSTNMTVDGEDLVATEDASYVVYDFGRLYVGYLTLEYETEQGGIVHALFDYSENVVDFETDARYYQTVKRLGVRKAVELGKSKVFLHRRRACRFMKLEFDCKVRLKKVYFKLSMTPSKQLGWFNCEDQLFNKMWEVGKYTLHINKHQEYESCPRNEMKYFSGDGIVDALIDYYAFGDDSLTYSSLSLTEPGICGGLVPDKLDRNVALTDYPSWRIISAYNQYLYSGDKYFVEQYFDELADCLDWLIGKMNSSYMIYQYPGFYDAFYVASDAVEFTCSSDRLGEKPLINALLYKSLLCMSEFAELVGDSRKEKWVALAEKVYEAFNERLWDNTVEAYVDTYDTSYIPHDGNALALLFGLAKGERAEKVKEALCKHLWTPYGSGLLSIPVAHTRDGSKTLSPAMNMHEAEARFLNDDPDGAVELMRRCWGTMLNKGAETFWEFAPTNGEDRWPIPAHAWSGGCTYLLGAYVLGIKPAKPGYEAVSFKPYAGFECYQGVVPTCKGLVAVNCHTENGRKIYNLAVPEGVEVEIHVRPEDEVTVTNYKV